MSDSKTTVVPTEPRVWTQEEIDADGQDADSGRFYQPHRGCWRWIMATTPRLCASASGSYGKMSDKSPTAIVHARTPKRRREKRAAVAYPNMPAIVGPPPRSLDPDPETLRRADKSMEVWAELVRQAGESDGGRR